MKFRKIPVPVEAQQVTHDNADELAAWCNGFAVKGMRGRGELFVTVDFYGSGAPHRAMVGDWIVRGPNGFYPETDTHFREHYEAVNDE